MAADTDQSKTVGGLTVYLGVMPAEIIRGPPMHGHISKGPHDYRVTSKSPHEYHIVAAIFDAASGERVSDAAVTAEVSGLGLSGGKKRLEPMQIAGTTPSYRQILVTAWPVRRRRLWADGQSVWR
jgi:hypothetical protein